MISLLFAIGLISAILSAILVMALMPAMRRYALARPNARSSHREPTPQGGGIAVVGATLAIVWLPAVLLGGSAGGPLILTAIVAGLALVGGIDDIRPLPASLRLVLQALAVGALLAADPTMRVLPDLLPVWAERALILVAGVWFVNLVNFMDGLDLMTVAEMVPLCATVAALGLVLREYDAMLIAGALAGALIGFAPFNRPVARLFLGDVGSLPIGLLAGFCLWQIAGAGALAAALILPLYYLADATITLLVRLRRGERIFEAHRTHFYQRATDHGFSVKAVTAHVFVLNLILSGLAGLSVAASQPWQKAGLVLLAAAAVAFVLRRFSRPREKRA